MFPIIPINVINIAFFFFMWILHSKSEIINPISGSIPRKPSQDYIQKHSQSKNPLFLSFYLLSGTAISSIVYSWTSNNFLSNILDLISADVRLGWGGSITSHHQQPIKYVVKLWLFKSSFNHILIITNRMQASCSPSWHFCILFNIVFFCESTRHSHIYWTSFLT